MRASTLASLSLCAALSACGGSSADTRLPEPQGPGDDSCAVYVERVAAGVRCQAIDANRCTCERVAALGDPPPATPPAPPADANLRPTDPGPATPPQPTPASGAATLAFAPGPANTTVTCVAGPCPDRNAEVITAPYPPIPAAPSGTALQLEFRAPGHKPYVGSYTVYPGTNRIPFTLEPDSPPRPDSAVLQFQNAPPGATVECISGPCPDNKPHAADGSFPPVKLAQDDTTLLLRFSAPGYRTATSSFQVSRGPNILPVLMERATSGKGR
jgi:hypothetical protein